MFSLSLLLAEATEAQTNAAVWIAVGLIVLLAAAFVVLCVYKRELKTQEIVYAGLSISLSLVLTLLSKLIPSMPLGGSITLAAMLPVMLFAYYFGFFDGLIAGLVFSLLQFITSPYIFTAFTFMLDYILAYCSVALMGFAKKIPLKEWVQLALGTAAVYLFRYAMHTISGIIYFDAGWIVDGLPAENALIYSLLYNGSYILPDFAICLFVILTLSFTKTVDRLRPKAH